MPKIKKIDCHKIVNSRGDWTIQTKVTLEDGSEGIQTIPEGASTGENEAISIPVDKAVDIVQGPINDALKGEYSQEQDALDMVMIEMDGTPNKRHLGCNSILSVSLALARANAVSQKMELYEYLGYLYDGKEREKKRLVFPAPVFNILNGGKHAHNNLSFQEFMIIPKMGLPFDKSMEIGVDIYRSLKNILIKNNFDVDVGDEGGFAPNGFNTDKALSFIRNAASEKYTPGKDIFFGMDVAAGSFHEHDEYFLPEENLRLSTEELLKYHSKILNKYEVIYFEDPFYEKDYDGWAEINKKFGKKLMIVADDLVVTNNKFLKTAIRNDLANAVIVKPNQVGTLTETLNFVREAKEHKMNIVISHRSGETAEDTFIADLALAVYAEFIKSGAPVRGERVVKYNRLLEVFNSVNL